MNLKRIIFTVALIFAFSSCSAVPSETVRPNRAVNGIFLIHYLQSEYTVKLAFDEGEKLTADIISPDVIKNVSVICNADGMLVKCGDVQIKCTDGYYPFAELYKTLLCVKNSELVKKTNNKDDCIFEYKNANEKYTVVTDEIGTVKEIKTSICDYIKR